MTEVVSEVHNITNTAYNPNNTINLISTHLNLSYYTRSIAFAILQHSLSILEQDLKTRLTDEMIKKVAETSLLIAIKSSDAYFDAESFKKSTGSAVDVELELKIAGILQFKFEFFDVYGFVKNLCMFLGSMSEIKEKINIIDNVFYSNRIKNFNLVNGSIEPIYLSLSVFSDKEIETFEAVNLITVDREVLSKAREIVKIE